MNLPALIAKALYDHGVRLADESSNCALHDKMEQRIKADVANLVINHGNCIELEVNTDRIQAMGIEDAVRMSAWEYALYHLTGDVDEELWNYQNQAAADAYTDARIDHIKESRSAA